MESENKGNVFFCRHFQSEHNNGEQNGLPGHLDPLSKTGIKQGNRVGRVLANFFRDNGFGDRSVKILSTTFVRGVDSVEIISEQIWRYITNVETDPALIEWGAMASAGISMMTKSVFYPLKNENDVLMCKDSQERLLEILAKIDGDYGRFAADAPEKAPPNVLVMSHATVLNKMMQYLLCEISDAWDPNKTFNNGTIRRLKSDGEGKFAYKGVIHPGFAPISEQEIQFRIWRRGKQYGAA